MEHIKTMTGNAAAGLFTALVLTGAAYALWLGAPLLNSTVDHVFASDIPVIRMSHAPVATPAVAITLPTSSFGDSRFSSHAGTKSAATPARTYTVSAAHTSAPTVKSKVAETHKASVAEKSKSAETPKVAEKAKPSETPTTEKPKVAQTPKTEHKSATTEHHTETAAQVRPTEQPEDH
jgi:outer membrane biosynthesis protein TonB